MEIIDKLNLGKAILNNTQFLLADNVSSVHIVSDQFFINLVHIVLYDISYEESVNLAYEFSRWEQDNVFRYTGGWETIREKYGVDWDECLEDFISYKKSGKKRPWKFDFHKFKATHE